MQFSRVWIQPKGFIVNSTFQSLLAGEHARVFASLLVLGGAFAANHISVQLLKRKLQGGASVHTERSRQRHVMIKNGVVLFAFLAICAIWATLIAGVALSMAAVATAVVISGKELIMCGTGYFMYTVSRPFKVGDFVEIDGVCGRVVDVDLFSTVLSEATRGYQITGRVITIPNSVLLAKSVQNHSATGEYVIGMVKIAVPNTADRDKCEQAALSAGNAVCEKWQKHADSHFQRIESKDFVDLPSSKVKVLWESDDAKNLVFLLRFACPLSQRAMVQQEILRQFWRQQETYLSKGSSPPAEASH